MFADDFELEKEGGWGRASNHGKQLWGETACCLQPQHRGWGGGACGGVVRGAAGVRGWDCASCRRRVSAFFTMELSRLYACCSSLAPSCESSLRAALTWLGQTRTRAVSCCRYGNIYSSQSYTGITYLTYKAECVQMLKQALSSSSHDPARFLCRATWEKANRQVKSCCLFHSKPRSHPQQPTLNPSFHVCAPIAAGSAVSTCQLTAAPG